MLCKAKVAVCSDKHTEHVGKISVQNIQFLNVKPGDIILFIYFNNGRYIECLSLTYATDKSKT